MYPLSCQVSISHSFQISIFHGVCPFLLLLLPLPLPLPPPHLIAGILIRKIICITLDEPILNYPYPHSSVHHEDSMIILHVHKHTHIQESCFSRWFHPCLTLNSEQWSPVQAGRNCSSDAGVRNVSLYNLKSHSQILIEAEVSLFKTTI